MSEKQALCDLYVSLKEQIREIEEVVLRQTEVIFAQCRAILTTKNRLDRLIAAYLKLEGVVDKLVVDENKKYDEKMDEVTDIIVSKQKYKM